MASSSFDITQALQDYVSKRSKMYRNDLLALKDDLLASGGLSEKEYRDFKASHPKETKADLQELLDGLVARMGVGRASAGKVSSLKKRASAYGPTEMEQALTLSPSRYLPEEERSGEFAQFLRQLRERREKDKDVRLSTEEKERFAKGFSPIRKKPEYAEAMKRLSSEKRRQSYEKKILTTDFTGNRADYVEVRSAFGKTPTEMFRHGVMKKLAERHGIYVRSKIGDEVVNENEAIFEILSTLKNKGLLTKDRVFTIEELDAALPRKLADYLSEIKYHRATGSGMTDKQLLKEVEGIEKVKDMHAFFSANPQFKTVVDVKNVKKDIGKDNLDKIRKKLLDHLGGTCVQVAAVSPAKKRPSKGKSVTRKPSKERKVSRARARTPEPVAPVAVRARTAIAEAVSESEKDVIIRRQEEEITSLRVQNAELSAQLKQMMAPRVSPRVVEEEAMMAAAQAVPPAATYRISPRAKVTPMREEEAMLTAADRLSASRMSPPRTASKKKTPPKPAMRLGSFAAVDEDEDIAYM